MLRTPVTNRSELADCKRIVVKIGTRLITDRATGLNKQFLDSVGQQMAALREEGHEFIIVTSGAIFLGRQILALATSRDSLPVRQAAAAAGQPALIRHWAHALGARNIRCAQMLLTQDDMSFRSRYLNVRNTIATLLEHGIVPVINENDSVSTEGITFEENDRLAALVASTAMADLAIYLSDQEGLFTANPQVDSSAQLICQVNPDEDFSECADGAGGPESRGGMEAKLAAAKLLADCGIAVVMANGRQDRVISRIVDGENVGTFFVPGQTVQGRKLWIRTAMPPTGDIIVDTGAARALQKPDGASLLPIGIVDVRGAFDTGDLVRIVGPDNVEIARGLTNYPSAEVIKIRGLHTSRLEKTLGHVGHHVVVHRDNMVISD